MQTLCLLMLVVLPSCRTLVSGLALCCCGCLLCLEPVPSCSLLRSRGPGPVTCSLQLLLLRWQLGLGLIWSPEGPVVDVHGRGQPWGAARGCRGHLHLLLLLLHCTMLLLVPPAVAGMLSCRRLVGDRCTCAVRVDCSSGKRRQKQLGVGICPMLAM